MKIYYVANARMPNEKAHGIQLAKMCEAFLLSGADLELVLPGKGQGGSLKEFYGLKVEIPVKRLPVLNLGFLLSSISFMLSYYFYLWRKKDVIVYTIDMDNFSFLPIRFLGLPYFVELHNTKSSALWNFFLRKARGTAVINNNVKNGLIKNFGIPESKIIVKPNGIDLEMFSGEISKGEARKRLGIIPDKKMAVYVGRETYWKGMEILDDVKKFYLPDIVRIIDDRPFREIPYWLAAADLLLVLGTKKNEYSYMYTSPMKIFEYMTSGRPILAADTPANREILSENEAYFYEPDDAKDLADKIKHLLTNPPDLKLKVDNARKKVEQYTWAKRAEAILAMMRI